MTRTLWHHKCRRGIICFLGLEIDECPYCGATQKEAKKPWNEETEEVRARPVSTDEEEEDD
jgi:hypothetical protein